LTKDLRGEEGGNAAPVRSAPKNGVGGSETVPIGATIKRGLLRAENHTANDSADLRFLARCFEERTHKTTTEAKGDDKKGGKSLPPRSGGITGGGGVLRPCQILGRCPKKGGRH